MMNRTKIISKPSKTIQIDVSAKKSKPVKIDFEDLNDDYVGNLSDTSITGSFFDNKIVMNSVNQNDKERLNKDKKYDNFRNLKSLEDDFECKNDVKKEKNQKKPVFNKNETTDFLYPEGFISNLNGLNTEFILCNLNHDKRIKSWERMDNIIFVDFWCINGSLSFYKQYCNFIDMNFTETWEKHREYSKREKFSRIIDLPWREAFLMDFSYHLKPFTMAIHLKKMNLENENDLSENKENIMKEVKTSTDHSLFDDLEERTNYFSKMSKFFNANDVKVMQTQIENHNFNFIYTNTKMLAVGSNTNTLMQETIKTMSQNELKKLLSFIEYDMGPISATKYGAYVVQVFIESVHDKNLEEQLKNYMFPYTADLLKHPIGNYTVQKILRLDPKFVADRFIERYTEILSNDLGFKVFKRCLEEFKPYYDIIKIKNEDIRYLCPLVYKEIEELITCSIKK